MMNDPVCNLSPASVL
jgi:hypothetical protein